MTQENTKKALSLLIISQIGRVLREQAADPAGSSKKAPEPSGAPAPSPAPSGDSGGPVEPPASADNDPSSAGDTSGADASADLGGDMGGTGGDPGGDMGGEGLDDSEGGDLGGMGGGGGGGFLGSGGFAGGGGGGGGFSDSGGDGDSEDEGGSGEITPPGEPEKDLEDPVGAALREAEKVAGETTEVQKILNAVKASIQVNFSDYREAWPLVNRLEQTENKTLQAVAQRLALFIAGVLQERGRVMKITKEELRKMVREAVRQKLMAENSNYVEQERMRQEVNMLALEFLEKLTQKLNIDPATLSPEALESYRRTHKGLETAIRMSAAELFQLGTVLAAAGGEGQGNSGSGGSSD